MSVANSYALLVLVSQYASSVTKPLACRRDAGLAATLLQADGFHVRSIAEEEVTYQTLKHEVRSMWAVHPKHRSQHPIFRIFSFFSFHLSNHLSSPFFLPWEETDGENSGSFTILLFFPFFAFCFDSAAQRVGRQWRSAPQVSRIPRGIERVVLWFLGHGLLCPEVNARPYGGIQPWMCRPDGNPRAEEEVVFALTHTQCLGLHCSDALGPRG